MTDSPGSAVAEPAAASASGLVLVGNPNVGKSVIFGVLTGRYVTVSNYPGTTVEVTRGYASHGGTKVPVTDTPGINTLIPQSEDERVTRDILLEDQAPVVQVGDEKNLTRTLMLSLQLAEAGRPFVLCLNMSDEAESQGLSTDAASLSSRLGIDVVKTVATRREGTSRILSLAGSARLSGVRPVYDQRLEEAVAEIEPLVPDAPISRRAIALMLLAGDASLADWLRARAPEPSIGRIEAVRLALQRRYSRSIAWVINEQRLKIARGLAEQVTSRRPRSTGALAAYLGAATMHAVWGVPVLLGVLYAMYLFVGVFGAGTAVDFLESGIFGKELASLTLAVTPDGLVREVPAPPGRDRRLRVLPSLPDARTVDVALEERADPEPGGSIPWSPVPGETLRAFSESGSGVVSVPVQERSEGVYHLVIPSGSTRIGIHDWSGWINPALVGWLEVHSPWALLTDFFAGPYGLVTMGLTYAIAIVLPIVVTFFLAFSFLEDSGYLPRLAIMVNRAFKVMGLNGKAVLPMVLGLGCDTMATLTTRILETKKERMIVILLLALGIPCSAQLGVVLGMLAGISWQGAAIWMGVVAGVIVLVGWGASKVIPGRGSDFILEIPPLRWPAIGNIVTKTMARVEWYVREAVPLFLLGTVLLFVADRTGLLRIAERAVSPLVSGVLDLPSKASEAFIIGFLRRDFGSAGLYRLAEDGLLDPIQIVVSLVTVTLFIPCIANFFMIVKERGMKAALIVAGFVFPFAVLVGGVLNLTLRSLGVRL
jgi:ferrous iron transport protein B